MERYIDADELELEYYDLSIHGTMAVKSVLPIFTDLLKKQPTADVVEVVLCRECVKHGKRECIVNRKMSLYDHVTTTKADAFCSEGKRRE